MSRLYFEELSTERVLDIYEREQAKGLVASVGGQQPQNIMNKCVHVCAVCLYVCTCKSACVRVCVCVCVCVCV